MKLNSKQYAQVLYKMISGQNKEDAKAIARNFVGVMESSGDFNKAGRMVAEFDKIWNKENNIVSAGITTVGKADNKTVKAVIETIKGKTNAREILLEEKIAKDILGGIIIEYQDKVVDGSLKMILNELKGAMVK